MTTLATPEQLALDLSPLVEPLYTPDMSIAQRFTLFHEHNPHVADAIETLCAQWLARRPKVGVKAAVEALRWTAAIQTDGPVYKLDNSFTSLYARLMLDRHPEWTDRIELRALASERSVA